MKNNLDKLSSESQNSVTSPMKNSNAILATNPLLPTEITFLKELSTSKKQILHKHLIGDLKMQSLKSITRHNAEVAGPFQPLKTSKVLGSFRETTLLPHFQLNKLFSVIRLMVVAMEATPQLLTNMLRKLVVWKLGKTTHTHLEVEKLENVHSILPKLLLKFPVGNMLERMMNLQW